MRSINLPFDFIAPLCKATNRKSTFRISIFFHSALERLLIAVTNATDNFVVRSTCRRSRREICVFFRFFFSCMHVQQANGQQTNECNVWINLCDVYLMRWRLERNCDVWPQLTSANSFYFAEFTVQANCKHGMNCNRSPLNWLHPNVLSVWETNLIFKPTTEPKQMEWPSKYSVQSMKTKRKKVKQIKCWIAASLYL